MPDQEPKTRVWTVDAERLPDSGEMFIDTEQLLAAVNDLIPILARIGGVATIGAVRDVTHTENEGTPQAREVWDTVRYVFRWDSYAPGPKVEPAVEEPKPAEKPRPKAKRPRQPEPAGAAS